MNVRELTAEEQEFIAIARAGLPPVIARKEVSKLLGGVISPYTLVNEDGAGRGPKGWKVGNRVVYSTDALIEWLVRRYDLTPLRGCHNLGA